MSDLLFRKPPGVVTRWISFENLTGEKGRGGLENQGHKGRPCHGILPGKKATLLDLAGPGVIRRIWMTTTDTHQPNVLRSLGIEIFWEGEKRPAVAGPLGDFFGVALGRKTAFESALFSDPEGRSFNCFIPMPFRKHAKIVLTNGSKKTVTVFFEVDVTLGDELGDDALYFHSSFRRENPTKLGREFEILPKVKGTGRYLGASIGLIENPSYYGSWFGEGEVKVYLDGDKAHPTLCGTGTEDFIGTAWGQKKFAHRTQGCPIQDLLHWSFYRYHVDDPVYFDDECRVTIQNMGGASRRKIREFLARGAKLKVVTVATEKDGIVQLLNGKKPLDYNSSRFNDDNWCNFYRQDDLCATAYFYLNTPTNSVTEPGVSPDWIVGI